MKDTESPQNKEKKWYLNNIYAFKQLWRVYILDLDFAIKNHAAGSIGAGLTTSISWKCSCYNQYLMLKLKPFYSNTQS